MAGTKYLTEYRFVAGYQLLQIEYTVYLILHVAKLEMKKKD